METMNPMIHKHTINSLSAPNALDEGFYVMCACGQVGFMSREESMNETYRANWNLGEETQP